MCPKKDADRLIEGACRDLVKTRGYKIAWILLFDRDHGFKKGFCTGIDRQFDQFLAQVAEGNLPFCLKKMLSRPEIMVIEKLQKECAGCSLIKENQYKQVIAPISSKHRFYGVLSISLEETIYGKKELDLLKEISDDLFLGLNNIYLEQERDKAIKDLEISYRHTKEALDGTIKALSSIVEYKDPYTHSHQIRVAILAKKIARQMGLPGHEIEAIGIGSLVHDIGKISIPASILSKPGKLSEIEKK
ncbi:MAG: HD domain-containing protein [Actinomycetota bacterium]|nr:HD domain-containing protein [Actinomycetota bacterium]